MKILAFRGRIGRQGYFGATVLLFVLGLVFGSLFVVGVANSDIHMPAKDVPEILRAITMPVPLGWTSFTLGVIGLVYVVLGSIGISVRRLHDFGLTGFFVLLYPVLKHVVPDTHWPDAMPGPADLLWDLIMIAQPGTRGPNAFGPDPRGSSDDTAPEPKFDA